MHRTDVKTAKKASKATVQTSSKILVRNVPFQATAQEITELFKYVLYRFSLLSQQCEIRSIVMNSQGVW